MDCGIIVINLASNDRLRLPLPEPFAGARPDHFRKAHVAGGQPYPTGCTDHQIILCPLDRPHCTIGLRLPLRPQFAKCILRLFCRNPAVLCFKDTGQDSDACKIYPFTL